MNQIFIFGASITFGCWDLEGGWVQRLKKDIGSKEKEDLIYNLAVPGDSTSDILKRLETELKNRIDRDYENIIILSGGNNDSIFFKKENKNNIPEKIFKENIKKLISISKRYSSKIIYVGITPCDEKKTNPILWLEEGSYLNSEIKKYNEIIKIVCSENKIQFVDIYDRLIDTEYIKTLEDGIHPNDKGHEIIFEIIKKYFV